MTIPMGVLLLVAAGYALRHKGADSPGMFLGVCIGVTGANGWVGEIVRQLMASATQAVEQLSQVKVL